VKVFGAFPDRCTGGVGMAQTATLVLGWLVLVSAVGALRPEEVHGQLRPLPPMEWELFEDSTVATARMGAGMLHDQRASLAGTQGRLLELGDFALAIRSGRMAVEVAGTVLRLFDDEETFATPFGGAREGTGERRRDAGDFRVSTMVLLTPPDQPASALLRFGVRLPTTDNEVGLERDRTDFFALLGGRLQRNGYSLAGEAGVGINGTHDAQMEQSDVLMYSAVAAYRWGSFAPRASLVGHMDGMNGWTIRGNEELSEVRLGARWGRQVWIETDLVHGLQPFSPRIGILVSGGITY
jgi:hypothetical protein